MDQEVPLLRSTRTRGARRLFVGFVVVQVAVLLLLSGWVGYRGAARRTASAEAARWARNRVIVIEAAHRLEMDPSLLLAVSHVESGYRDDCVSPKGAIGLLQVMPETGAASAERLGLRDWSLEDPRDNALIGGEYLGRLLRRYRNDLHLALAAYNAGPGRVDDWVQAGPGLPGPEVVDQFAFAETRQYVSNVYARATEPESVVDRALPVAHTVQSH